jgi:membrane-associated phospholipid phosphatase
VLQLIRQNRIYFICLGIYFLIGGITLVLMEKGSVELSVNRRHGIVFDYFFQTITFLGDGLFIAPFILFIFLFDSIYKGVVLLVSVLSTFVCVQIFKKVIFTNMPRPSAFFPESQNIYYIEGLEIHTSNSFPSGHSAQAFAFLLVLALFAKNKTLGPVIFFLFAFSTAFSRVYLMQHFLIDTYFGALIATVFTIIIYLYFANYTKLSERERWQKGLFL